MSAATATVQQTLEAALAGEPEAVVMALLSAVFAMALAVAVKGLILGAPKSAMKADEFQNFNLIKKEVVSHNTRRFTFALQTPTTRLGLPIGQHITLRFTNASGKKHQRSYTPVTGDETPGLVTFVIKIYKAGVHPKFPEGGKMSQHLDSLSIGDSMEMKGPKGHLTYLGRGTFTVKQMRKPLQTRTAKHFGLIAGGTGITPCLQIIHAVLSDPKDSTTTLSLLYANVSEDDILLREELDETAKKYPGRFRVHYTLDKAPKGWAYSEGFINKDMIEKHLPAHAKDGSSQVLMCGPPPMLKFACIPALTELGFTEDDYFSF